MLRRYLLSSWLFLSMAAPGLAADPALSGYFDPAKNTFTPVVQLPFAAPAGDLSSAAAERAATVVRSGTIIVTVKATLKTVPDDFFVTMIVGVNSFDNTFSSTVSKSVTVPTSGNTATATVELPYTFMVDAATPSIGVFATISNPTFPFPRASQTRSIALPAAGAKTKITITPTL